MCRTRTRAVWTWTAATRSGSAAPVAPRCLRAAWASGGRAQQSACIYPPACTDMFLLCNKILFASTCMNCISYAHAEAATAFRAWNDSSLVTMSAENGGARVLDTKALSQSHIFSVINRRRLANFLTKSEVEEAAAKAAEAAAKANKENSLSGKGRRRVGRSALGGNCFLKTAL
eukprot:3250706-Pleurochrysis_carterae.AAC.1